MPVVLLIVEIVNAEAVPDSRPNAIPMAAATPVLRIDVDWIIVRFLVLNRLKEQRTLEDLIELSETLVFFTPLTRGYSRHRSIGAACHGVDSQPPVRGVPSNRICD